MSVREMFLIVGAGWIGCALSKVVGGGSFPRDETMFLVGGAVMILMGFALPTRSLWPTRHRPQQELVYGTWDLPVKKSDDPSDPTRVTVTGWRPKDWQP